MVDVISDNAEEDLAQLWEELRSQEDFDESISFADYLNVDQNVITNDVLSLEEIAQAWRANPQEELDSDEDGSEIEEIPLPPVTRKAAYQGFNTLRKYVEENASDSKVVELCHYLEEFLYVEQRKKSVQTTMDRFL